MQLALDGDQPILDQVIKGLPVRLHIISDCSEGGLAGKPGLNCNLAKSEDDPVVGAFLCSSPIMLPRGLFEWVFSQVDL